MFATQSKYSDHSSDYYIQPQLEVGSQEDEYEKEANDVGDRVMRMSEGEQMPKMSTGDKSTQGMKKDEEPNKMVSPNEEKIQMMVDYPAKTQKISDGNRGAMAAPQQVEQGINNGKGSGQLLAANTRADLGHNMNTDYAGIEYQAQANKVVKTDDLHPTITFYYNLDSCKLQIVKSNEFANGSLQFKLVASRPSAKKEFSWNYMPDENGFLYSIWTPQPFDSTELKWIKMAYEDEMKPIIARERELEALNIKQGGLKLTDKTSSYDFAGKIESKLKNKLDKGNLKANERSYFKDIGLPMYLRMRQTDDITLHGETMQKNVWDVSGAIFILSLAIGEQGYTTDRKTGNYWGVGGADNFQKMGSSFDLAFDNYLDFLSKGYYNPTKQKRDGVGWSDAVKLLESGNLTADKMNKALRSGRFFPSESDRHAGKYAYNTDKSETNTSGAATNVYYKDSKTKERYTYQNYAGDIIDSAIMENTVLRFAKFLQEDITTLETTKKTDAETRYKIALYQSVLFELGEFMLNDYPTLLKSRDERDAE